MNAIHLLYIAVGGALGAVSRALISHWLRGSFPWGTLTVNVLGSLIIGVVLGWMVVKTDTPHAVRFLFATGFCGAFTTFSTFSFETLAMFEQHRWEAGLGNVAMNVLLCLGATWLGIRLAMTMASA